MNHSNDKTEPFLTATEIAKSLGICRESLRKMVLAGTVTGYRAHAKARRLYLLSEVRNCLLSRRCTPDDERRRAAEAAVKRAMRAQGLSLSDLSRKAPACRPF